MEIMSLKNEGDVHNMMVDWTIAVASLLYCHGIGILVAEGTARFLAVFPVICLFVYLPFNLNTMFLCGPTTFFMSWLGSFKLILFAYGLGPLSSHPTLPLCHFILTACLPIKIIRNNEKQSHRTTMKSPINYAPKVLLFIVTIKAFSYKDNLHPFVATCVYAYCLFFMLELLLAVTAYIARAMVGVELEPQFDEPHHATSVQNFWGKRWNLMVSSILRPTVYHPARSIFGHIIPERWVSVPAVFTTFLVSGVVHELIFYYLGRLTPTWEITWFFILQGVWTGMEIVVKKTMGHWFKPPTSVTRFYTLSFVMLTLFWLFFPPFLRIDPYTRSCKEAMAFVGFIKDGKLHNPSEYECPFI
ncbi:hypothetical protein CTI12_AA135710 [Artemisia annua]|uniref:Wax synthase domain-containing protein n=1 Tax=Artemisia annua TaxID=35608 RepID=A0A2U1PML1_ARTAN|nr:hypothetical protein CTI12_AA135710 [Artemisia annua]